MSTLRRKHRWSRATGRCTACNEIWPCSRATTRGVELSRRAGWGEGSDDLDSDGLRVRLIQNPGDGDAVRKLTARGFDRFEKHDFDAALGTRSLAQDHAPLEVGPDYLDRSVIAHASRP